MKKTSTQPRTLETRAHHYIGVRADGSAAASPDNHLGLSDLVWKYFSEEITEILTEAHKDRRQRSNHISKRK